MWALPSVATTCCPLPSLSVIRGYVTTTHPQLTAHPPYTSNPTTRFAADHVGRIAGRRLTGRSEAMLEQHITVELTGKGPVLELPGDGAVRDLNRPIAEPGIRQA